jgi:tRNA(fMet)-specific endonuclease VapC
LTYLIDTDWVADYLKGREAAVSLLDQLADEGIAISAITHGEIYEGIYYGRNPALHERGFRGFLRVAKVVPIDRKITARFARLRGDLRRRGQLIGDMDLLIAATAVDRDLVLVTRNIREFGRVPGLRLNP